MIVVVKRASSLNIRSILSEILCCRIVPHPDMKRQRSRRSADLSRFQQRQLKRRVEHDSTPSPYCY